MRNLRLLAIFVTLCAQLVLVRPSYAGPIYVFKESDGSVRFSSVPPPRGTQAQVFTAREGSFAYYKMGRPSFYASRHLFRNEFGPIIKQAAAQHSVDASLLRAVIHVESAFNSRAVSPKGARGLMQLMPGTAKLLGVRNSFDPAQNVHGGARYLSNLLRKYGGNVKLALAAYNAGPEAVERYSGIPPYQETVNYVKRVLYMKDRYRTIASS